MMQHGLDADKHPSSVRATNRLELDAAKSPMGSIFHTCSAVVETQCDVSE